MGGRWRGDAGASVRGGDLLGARSTAAIDRRPSPLARTLDAATAAGVPPADGVTAAVRTGRLVRSLVALTDDSLDPVIEVHHDDDDVYVRTSLRWHGQVAPTASALGWAPVDGSSIDIRADGDVLHLVTQQPLDAARH